MATLRSFFLRALSGEEAAETDLTTGAAASVASAEGEVAEGAGVEAVTEGVGTEGVAEGVGTEGVGTEGVGMEGVIEGVGTKGVTEGVDTEGVFADNPAASRTGRVEWVEHGTIVSLVETAMLGYDIPPLMVCIYIYIYI